MMQSCKPVASESVSAVAEATIVSFRSDSSDSSVAVFFFSAQRNHRLLRLLSYNGIKLVNQYVFT